MVSQRVTSDCVMGRSKPDNELPFGLQNAKWLGSAVGYGHSDHITYTPNRG